jgi:sugar lactone lactonase YvrE
LIRIDCVVDSASQLGEATYWDPKAQVLWWIDIYGPLIHCFDPVVGKDSTWKAPEYLGTLSVRAKGGLVVSMANGFYFFDPSSGDFIPICDPEAELEDTRFNDGKTDRQGRFWSGSMFEKPGKTPAKIGSLWRLDADLTAHRVIEGVGCSNGLAWSPDSRTMYFTDSHTHYVWAFDFDPQYGTTSNRRVFIDLADEGYIVDGATVDAAGNYWLTIPFMGKVLAYTPSGKRLRSIDMPCDLPTCCEFGGKNLDVLYVTSAIYRRDAETLAGQTKPGGLFVITGLDTQGLPLVPFAG